MPLSSRIIKSTQAHAEQTNEWVIDTAYDLEAEQAEEEPSSYDESEEIQEAKEKSASIINQALAEREALLQEAGEEIPRIKEEAKQQAYEEGFQEGYAKGFSEGKEEGTHAAHVENAALLQQARQMITNAQLDIEEYIEQNKDRLLKLSIHMAEKIVHEQLSLSADGILELVHPILHQLDRKEDYVSLTVHPSIRSFIKDKLPDLEANYSDVRFVVLQDETLNPLGCIVESAHKVIDLQVKKQLEAMVEELKESEREV